MIVRIWHGWTTADNADACQQLLDTTIVPGIIARDIPGLVGVDILRRRDGDGEEVEFVTVMTFDHWTAVDTLAGPSRTASVVPPAAQRLLPDTTNTPSTTTTRPLRCGVPVEPDGTEPDAP